MISTTIIIIIIISAIEALWMQQRLNGIYVVCMGYSRISARVRILIDGRWLRLGAFYGICAVCGGTLPDGGGVGGN